MRNLDPYDEPRGERSRRREIAQRATRRSATLTIASALVPGLGLLRTRYKRLGVLILFGVVLVLLAIIARVVMLGPTKAALSIAVSPNALLVAAAFALVAGLIWVFTPEHWDGGALWIRIVERAGMVIISFHKG